MSGGSFCNSLLIELPFGIAVHKSIDLRGVRGGIDTELKLRREEEWLRNLTERQRTAFPSLLESLESENEFAYRMKFVNGYTLSEKIFHNTVSSDDAIAVLKDVFMQLRRNFYGERFFRTRRSCMEPDYYDRIKRRTEMIHTNDTVDGRVLRNALLAEKLFVNGSPCLGVNSILDWVKSSNVSYKCFGNLVQEKCHGDLILDDIVVDRAASKSTLIDPNGDSCSRYYDIGKVCLSLLSYYEFFKYDLFDIEVSNLGSAVAIDLKLQHNQVAIKYEEIAAELPDILRSAEVLDSGQFDLDGLGLLLLNGLQNLALPMFHLLHHKQEERALAFLAIGALRMTSAYRLLEGNVRPPLLDTIRAAARFRTTKG